jgi:hypothetical protein
MEPEQELLVLAAGTAARRADRQARGRELAAVADWAEVRDLLHVGRLLPTLGDRLIELGGERAEPVLRPALEEALEHARRRDALLTLVGEQARSALTAAGIRSAPLKGPGLGERIYGEPGRRLSGDIDLLVAPEQLTAAVETIRQLGYDPPDDEVEANGLPLLHFSLVHSQHQLPPIELHWRIHWYEEAFSAERLLPPPSAAQAPWRPANEDELASLLLFYARDGFSGLRQASDLAAWWDRFGDGLPGGALERVASAYPALRPALSAATVVAARTVGLPADLLPRPLGRLGRRGRVAVRLADPRPYASREQLFAEVGLVDGLLTPRPGLPAFFRRQVAPPRRVIREHAEKAGVSSPGSSLGYGARMLVRYLFALGRLIRIPGTHRLRFGREAVRA